MTGNTIERMGQPKSNGFQTDRPEEGNGGLSEADEPNRTSNGLKQPLEKNQTEYHKKSRSGGNQIG